MTSEGSSKVLLLAITGIIVFLLLGSFLWFHRTDTAPKAPMHSAMHSYFSEMA